LVATHYPVTKFPRSCPHRIAKIQPAAEVGGLDSRFYVDACGVEDYAAALTVM
jgi:hypothetical protein